MNKVINKETGKKIFWHIRHFLGKMLLVIFILLLVIIGFSQTSTFRSFLKNQILSIAGDELNGEIKIGSIEGTLFTNLTINDFSYKLNDTNFVSAKKLFVSFSLIGILGKNLGVNDVVLEDGNINLIKFADNKWIFEKLLKKIRPEDTTESGPFNYTIILRNFELRNCSFNLKDLTNNTVSLKQINYDQLNFSDLTLNELNIRIRALADFKKKNFGLKIRDANFQTNVRDFGLKKFQLNLDVSQSKVDISNFIFKTILTDIKMRLSVKDINVFQLKEFEELKDKQVFAELSSDAFNFRDLRNLVPQVDMLNGNIQFYLNAAGILGQLKINKLKARLENTSLELAGTIKNITASEKLFLDINSKDSYIYAPDISVLLPLYNLNFLSGLEKVELRKLSYYGEPAKFKSELDIASGFGGIEGSSSFDFTGKLSRYEINLTTKEFNIHPFTNYQTSLNADLEIKGMSFDPETMNSTGYIHFYNSKFDGKNLDTLLLSFNGNDKIINAALEAALDGSSVRSEINLNLKDKKKPVYSGLLSGEHLNIANFVNKEKYISDINMSCSFSGEYFDLDKLSLAADLSFKNSIINYKRAGLDEIKISLDQKNLSKKYFNIYSNVADIEISGDFLPSLLIKTIPKEAELISDEITKKIQIFKNTLPTFDTIKQYKKVVINKTQRNRKTKQLAEQPYKLAFNIKLNDLTIINNFLDSINVSAAGKITGSLNNDNKEFNLSINNKIDNLMLLKGDSPLRAKNFNFDFSFNDKKEADSNLISSEINVFCEKFTNSMEIKNLRSKVSINPKLVKFRLSTEIDTSIIARTEGVIDISGSTYYAKFSKATVEYYKYKVTNEGILDFSFNKEGINFYDFNLRRKRETFSISGFIGLNNQQDLRLSLNKFSISDIVKNLIKDYPLNLDGQITLNAKIFGTAQSPIIEGEFLVDSTSVNSKVLGTLMGEVVYQDNKLETEVSYIDKLLTGKDVSLKAAIPLNINISEGKSEVIPDKDLEVNLQFSNFNLTPLQVFLLELKNTYGTINGNMGISGTYNNPRFTGDLKIDSTGFIISKTNLAYILNASISINENKIKLQEFKLENDQVIRDKGTMFASGEITIEDYKIKNIDIFAQGDLLVLNEESKRVNPQVFGTLLLSTETPLRIYGNENLIQLTGDLLLKKAALTIPFLESEYTKDDESFQYYFKRSKTETVTDSIEDVFNQLVLASQKKITKEISRSPSFSNFSAKLKIYLRDDVSLQFILSKELNQRLYTELNGNMIFNLIDNQVFFQGDIQVTPESYLVFYQRFNASGSLRFEQDIANPRLNITAAYQSYYTGSDTTGSNVKDVTVKIKLNGTVKELAKNLVQNKDNLSVEINGQPDKSKDASDIIAFIILGKFKNDLTAQDKSNVSTSLGTTAKNAATSLLGSLVSSFANNILGDVIRTVDFQQIGGQTIFSLSGRIEKLKFKLGGSTTSFQNIGTADIQLEYPLIEKLFLRLERKNSTNARVGNEIDMMNEAALKYKYEF